MHDPYTSLPKPVTIETNWSKYPMPGQLSLPIECRNAEAPVARVGLDD